MPKVSVIVPVYKVEKYVSKCIESILNQTCTDWELILVDDGSPDASGAICDEYARKDRRIRVIHKENGGVSSARNVGLDNATGEWVTFVDADDWIDMRCLELCFDSNSCADLYRFGMQSIYTTGGAPKNKIRIENTLSVQDYLKLLIARKTVLGVCGGIYRKDVISKFDIKFDERYVMGEDWLFNFHFIKSCSSICIIDEPLYTYNRFNENGCTKNFSIKKDLQMLEVAQSILCDKMLTDSVFNLSKADCKVKIYYEAVTHALSLTDSYNQLDFYTREINGLKVAPTFMDLLRSGCSSKEKIFVMSSRIGFLWHLIYKLKKK